MPETSTVIQYSAPAARFVRPRAAFLLVPMLAACAAAAAPSAAADDQPSRRVVVATVDGTDIYAHEVERELERAFGDRTIAPAVRPHLEQQALQQLVDRLLLLRYLEARQLAATASEVDRAVQQLEAGLAERGLELADHLARQQLDETALRRALRWQLSWERFVQRYLTEPNLKRYFDDHRRQFDGTALRVAHILLKVDAEDANALPATLEKARQLKQRMAAGEITFADAARQYSDAPTGDQGGDIGFIERRQPMPESFSKAAFALADGEVSAPVVTRFGVHLIRVSEVRPGQKRWNEVREDVEQAARKFLFQWAAEQQRGQSKAEFKKTGP